MNSCYCARVSFIHYIESKLLPEQKRKQGELNSEYEMVNPNHCRGIQK